ncbi:MAG: exodeoxyribonuclease VII small subunit [Oscillospiraceae bacterium]|nr:exodeoxyribonuclease VII small subunit [Oscillospiraceae bacterium]
MKKKKNFEESLNELENIVRILEKGDTGLDDALNYFEKGVALVKDCQNMLDNAQKRVLVITEDDEGNAKEEDFTGENPSD